MVWSTLCYDWTRTDDVEGVDSECSVQLFGKVIDVKVSVNPDVVYYLIRHNPRRGNYIIDYMHPALISFAQEQLIHPISNVSDSLSGAMELLTLNSDR